MSRHHLGRATRSAVLTAALTGTALVAGAAPAAAHETWFVHHPDAYPLVWGELARPAVVLGLVAVLAVALLWRTVAVRVAVPELAGLGVARLRRLSDRLGALTPWVPRLLAAHLGASLLLLVLSRAVVAPGVVVPDGAAGTALLVPQAVAGALLLAGRHVRLAAAAVVAAGPVLLVLSSTASLLACAALVGIAVFLVLVPPRRELGGRSALDLDRLVPAVLALRVGTAVTLVVLAVVEKLANPAMAAAMLDQVPVLNLLAPLGVSAATFALVAGLVEVLFGLLVLSGAAPQVVALVAAVPFTATLALFGGTELIGHLPVYGVLLTLLLLGSDPRTAPAVRALDLGRPVAAPR